MDYKTEERNTKLGYTHCPLAASFVTRRRAVLTNYPWTEQYMDQAKQGPLRRVNEYTKNQDRVCWEREVTLRSF